MKKRELAESELSLVISLKQKGYSWLKIQKETDIPRYAAKRAYEQWQRTKSTNELKEARKEVAAEEFRKHLMDLLSLAQSFLKSLHIPSISNLDINSNFKNYWEDILQVDDKNKFRLFGSLKEHTQERVNWQLLRDWNNAKIESIKNTRSLHTEVISIFNNLLSQTQNAALKTKMMGLSRRGISVDRLADFIVKMTLQGILYNYVDLIHVFEGTSLTSKGTVQLTFLKNKEFIDINDLDLAKEILYLCKWAFRNIQADRSSNIKSLENNFSTMKEIYIQFEESLNELALRPTILQTHCVFCPA